MQINGRDIGPGHPTYCIAEMSGEHKGDIARAYDLIYAAAQAGADAIKIQCFEPDLLAEARGGYDKVLTEGLWAGRSLGDLYHETLTPKGWMKDLFRYAKQEGITIFASVFHETDVEFLEHFVVCPALKIASREAADIELVTKAASTGKPLIISTGTATDEELGRSIAVASKHTSQIALLYCVSQYPAPIESIDFDQIGVLRHRYGLPVGFSDHTLGIEAAVKAVEHGACIIEKHLTLSRADGGPDAAFSLEPAELKELVRKVREC